MRWVLLPGRAPQLADELPAVQDLIDMEAILQQTRRWDLPLIEQGRAQGLEQGIEQGLEQGLERGRAEGEARTLRRQLSMKFGDLPSAMDERISVATTDQLEIWLDRVLTAESLSSVFAD
jgi:flagellar biosynthesis/type III secretory pathway protein FliH